MSDKTDQTESEELGESLQDHLGKLAKSALQVAPLAAIPMNTSNTVSLLAVFSPAIATLLGEYIPSRAQRKRLEFLINLGERIDELEESQKAMVQSEQFAMLFHRVVFEIGLEANQQKIKAYENSLLSALSLNVEEALQEAYFDSLKTLNPLHLEIVRALWVECRPRWVSYTYPGGDAVVEGVDLILTLPNRPVPLLYEFIHDLSIKGILVHLGDRGDWTLPSDDPATLNCSWTNFGIGLMNFITPEYPAPEFLVQRKITKMTY